MEKWYPEMLIAFMKSTTDSIYIKDEQGRFLMVSQTKADRHNLSYQTMLGNTDFNFMSHDEAEEARLDDLRVLETGEPVIDKIVKRTREDGSECYMSDSKQRWITESGEKILLGISRDVTQRIKTENHILTMLSIATHDMRGAIVDLGATLKLIAKGRMGAIDESAKNTVEDLLKRTKKLEGIVKDYLSKSALFKDSEIPSKKNIDLLEDIIMPILGDLADELEKRNIQIDNRLGSIPGGKIIVSANKVWLQAVYTNLFDNAMKHTNNGGVIAFGFEEKNGHYQLNVYNNGPGIPSENLEKIFQKFEGNGESTGVGLSICRDLIQKHGGNLWAENTRHGHPNFIFTLPKE
jgi:PAS domain S-box-containing protein